jgi:hypothetical protein
MWQEKGFSVLGARVNSVALALAQTLQQFGTRTTSNPSPDLQTIQEYKSCFPFGDLRVEGERILVSRFEQNADIVFAFSPNLLAETFFVLCRTRSSCAGP